MRKNIVAGNWKMNTTLNEALDLAAEVAEGLGQVESSNVTVVVAPPFPFLKPVVDAFKSTNVAVASQNCSNELSGAFTGEVAAPMLASVGASYAIIGHSERRAIFGETHLELAQKVDQALAAGLTPVFCVGEQLEQRKSGDYYAVIAQQLADSLYHLSPESFDKLVIAYEPVWAIGTGETASPEQAQEVHQFIRKQLEEQYGSEIASNTSILYGGSCKPSNAEELFSQTDVDGGLIGGASLKAADFLAIIQAF